MGFAGVVTAGVCSLVVGCAFNPTGLGSTDSPGPDAADATDAPGAAIDAPPGTPIDAPATCQADVDNDGICDDQDDWLCGARPSLGLPIGNAGDPRATVIALTLGQLTNVVDASPGATLLAAASVSLRDTNDACSGCKDQIELGWAGGGRETCWDFGNPAQGITHFDAGTFTLDVPTTPGRHDLVIQVAQADSCNANSSSRTDGWYAAVPSGPIVGAVCVR